MTTVGKAAVMFDESKNEIFDMYQCQILKKKKKNWILSKINDESNNEYLLLNSTQFIEFLEWTH